MNGYSFFPEAFSLEAYRRMIYPGSPLFRSYGVTIVMVVAGTFLAVIMTYFAAYPETNCQGLFNQIHKKATKKCQKQILAPDTFADGLFAPA